MADADLSFARVIAPISFETFQVSHFERAPLAIHRNQPEFYAPLVSLDRLDQYLTSTLPSTNDITLVKFGHDQNSDDYTTPDGRIDPARVWSMFADGWTIVFQGMQRHLPELAGLCRGAEATFSQPFQTNLYLTPPSAQGFSPHWDTHDVFILQVVGSKDWLLYDTKVELPLKGQHFERAEHQPGDVSQSLTLRAGDLLYCPRGLMHDARSTNEASLHITFGLMGRTWADLLFETVADFALNEPAARRLLPLGFAQQGFDTSLAEAHFRSLLQGLATRAELAPRLNQLAESFIDDRPPLMANQLRQMLALDSIGPGTQLGARPHLILRYQQEPDTVTVMAHGRSVTLPIVAADALRFALDHPRFTPEEVPGPLDMPGRLVLLRRLVADGLVRILDI